MSRKPIPTHLKGWIVPQDRRSPPGELVAKLRCPCGGEAFELHYPGQTRDVHNAPFPVMAEFHGRPFFLIKAVCAACAQEVVLIDRDFHGWNGLIRHDPEQAALTRPPLTPWRCLACDELPHTVMLHIQYESELEFLKKTGGKFLPERWPDAFGDFAMDIQCARCEEETPLWIDIVTL